MFKYRVIKILILVLFFVILLVNCSEATDNGTCEVSLIPNKTTIKEGESLIYEIKVENIDAGDGITSVGAVIEYDDSIFDFVTVSDNSIKWSLNNQAGYLFISTNDSLPTKQNQTVAKLKFTAKQNASLGKQEIKLSKIDITYDDNDDTKLFHLEDVSSSVTIVKNDNDGNNNRKQ